MSVFWNSLSSIIFVKSNKTFSEERHRPFPGALFNIPGKLNWMNKLYLYCQYYFPIYYSSYSKATKQVILLWGGNIISMVAYHI